jgi:hypothetical protein
LSLTSSSEIPKARKRDDGKKGSRELSLVEQVTIELDPSLTKRCKPRKTHKDRKSRTNYRKSTPGENLS